MHLHEEGFELLTHGRVEEVFGLVDDFLGNALANQELRRLISEVVTVMIDEVILFSSILVRNIIQKVFKDFLGDFGTAHINFFDRFTVGSSFRMIVADSASKVVFSAVDDERRVVDGVDLLADQHHAETFGHALGDVVKGEGDLFGHLKIS